MHKMYMGEKEKDTPGNFSEKDTKIIESSSQAKMKSQSVSKIKEAAGLKNVNIIQKPLEFFGKKKDKK